MKRFALKQTALALAALTAMGGLTATTAYADQPGQYGSNNNNNRHDDHNDNRNNNNGARWDQSQHNGYTYNGRWNYGPPPATVIGRPGFQPGFHQWRRGDRIPAYYRTRYATVDYRHEHLRAPPRGYHYVRDDRGDVLLAAIATGAILSVILNH